MIEIWENAGELTQEGKQLEDDVREKLEPIIIAYAAKKYHSADAYNIISDVLFDLWEKHSPLSEHIKEVEKQYMGDNHNG